MSPTAEEIVSKTGELPLFPHVASKVMTMVNDPDTSARDLQEVIITDQAMTARILKISNSAMFGLKREVRTLTHAITLLGFNTIRSIVIAAAAKNVYKSKGGSSFMERLIWESAIANALIARMLSEKSGNVNKEEAFIGGLMHNVGKTVLNNHLGDAYMELVKKAYNEGVSIQKLEKEALGFEHAEIGHIILQKWNLSMGLTESVRWYTQPENASEDYRELAATIGFAALLCLDQGLGAAKPVPLEEYNIQPFTDILRFQPEQVAKWREIVELKVKEDADMFKSL